MEANIKGSLESLLLVMSGAVSYKKLSELSGFESEKIKNELKELSEEYKKNNRGFQLIMTDKEVQLVTNSLYAPLVEKAVKSEIKEELTPAAVETLAIIAYKGALKKPEIDFIRGVNCAYTLRSLMVRGLIERQQDGKDTRTFVYSITPDFLSHLGVANITELPEYQEISSRLEALKNENQGTL